MCKMSQNLQKLAFLVNMSIYEQKDIQLTPVNSNLQGTRKISST